MRQPNQVIDSIQQKTPLVVGAIADSETLSQIPSASECDILELRLDSLGFGSEVVDFAKNSHLPLLITARGPIEGGQSDWTIEDRTTAYQALMPHASLIDIELRDLPSLTHVVTEARKSEIIVVGSFHDFEKTPSLDFLSSKFNQDLVDIHKFALMANSLNDIKSHCSLIESLPHQKLSIMGMGPLGAAARPLMAKAGSLLNYGYLGDTPTAPDQWSAKLLKEAISV